MRAAPPSPPQKGTVKATYEDHTRNQPIKSRVPHLRQCGRESAGGEDARNLSALRPGEVTACQHHGPTGGYASPERSALVAIRRVAFGEAVVVTNATPSRSGLAFGAMNSPQHDRDRAGD